MHGVYRSVPQAVSVWKWYASVHDLRTAIQGASARIDGCAAQAHVAILFGSPKTQAEANIACSQTTGITEIETQAQQQTLGR
jgi:hypothetical protein